MNVTVDVQNNPTVTNAGTNAANATLIHSGVPRNTTGTVTYQIRRRDRVGNTITVRSSDSTSAQVLGVSVYTLEIILDNRTNYEARTRHNSGSWTGWQGFKTRDKRYQSPDAITQLADDSHDSATVQGNVTYNVFNSAKATVTDTASGATVTNTDNVTTSTASITNTSRGATVVNSDPIQTSTTGK